MLKKRMNDKKEEEKNNEMSKAFAEFYSLGLIDYNLIRNLLSNHPRVSKNAIEFVLFITANVIISVYLTHTHTQTENATKQERYIKKNCFRPKCSICHIEKIICLQSIVSRWLVFLLCSSTFKMKRCGTMRENGVETNEWIFPFSSILCSAGFSFSLRSTCHLLVSLHSNDNEGKMRGHTHKCKLKNERKIVNSWIMMKRFFFFCVHSHSSLRFVTVSISQMLLHFEC